MNKKQSIDEMREVADKVIALLKDEGFVVQKYESITTSSIYLKLDYGVSNSIRISDHKGKKHLQYRYNVLSSIPNHIPYHSSVTKEGWKRHYYQPTCIDIMVNQILSDRHDKLEKYGSESYRGFMEKNRQENAGRMKGFWAKAQLV